MCTRCVRYCCQRKEKVLSISNVKYVLLWDNREMKEIKEYINALPEVYQNIYGYHEFDGESSRHCEQREEVVVNIIKKYQQKLGKKNLRILDLGCAQGYYSFSLAAQGCVVEGIDLLDQNISLCKVLQKENQLDCCFRKEKITLEMVQMLEDKKYDVILLFSVIHHICNEYGFEYARKLLETLVQKCTFMLTELALKEEPLYWRERLPEDYSVWFENIAFFDEQAFFETHLSEFRRPLLFCSAQYVFVNNIFHKIDRYSIKAYQGKKEDPSKRYYFCDGKSTLIKCFRNADKSFMDDLRREISFLRENQDLMFLPRVLFTKDQNNCIIEVTGIRYGRLLWDDIRAHKSLDMNQVFLGVLNNCVELETRGWFHGDLRIWNIVVDEDGTGRLIDFGNVTRDSQNDVLKSIYNHRLSKMDVYDAFAASFYDALTSRQYRTIDENGIYNMTLYYDFDEISEKHAAFFNRFLLIKNENRSFEEIRRLFIDIVINGCVEEISDRDRLKALGAQIKRLEIQSADNVDIVILNKMFSDLYKGFLSVQEAYNQLDSQINKINNRFKSQSDNIKAIIDTLSTQIQTVETQVAEIRKWLPYRIYRSVRRRLPPRKE